MKEQTPSRIIRQADRSRDDPLLLRLGMILEVSQVGLIEVDSENFSILQANSLACHITGFEKEGLMARDLLSLFLPQEAQSIKDVLNSERSLDPLEFTLVTLGGDHKRVEISWVRSPMGCDPPFGFLAMRDVSQRIQRERQAREAQERSKRIAELGEMGVLILDTELRIDYANHKAAQMLGIPHGSAVGSNLSAFLEREDRLKILALQSPLHLERGERANLELTIRRADGGSKVVEISLASAREPSGQWRTYAFLRDLTDRIRMENELRKANEFLQKVIRSSVDGIIAADMKGNIIIFNEGAERLLGYRAEEVIGKVHITQLYPPGMAKEIMRRLRSDNHGPPGKLPTTQTTLVAKDGEHIPVHISASIVYEGDQEVASVGIFTDLRERIKMQQQLEETYNQLLQSEKLASLGKLAAGVAHEINNPLGGILMYSNMLLERVNDPEISRDIQEIVEQTMRCKEIVKGLLEFARKSGDEKTLIQINQIIEKCVGMLRNQALFLNVRIECQLSPDIPLFLADSGQMHQVFTNLLVNAAEAMDGKGQITIRTWHEEGPDGRIFVEVEDTGCGIPDEHLAKIFDPFFTTKTIGKGTGLGLSTTYGIIRMHGGGIEVRSSVGEGTTFRITLPVESETPPQDKASAPAIEEGVR